MRLYSDLIAEMVEADLLERSLWRMGNEAPPDNLQLRMKSRAIAPASCEFILHLFDLRTFNTILEIGRAGGHSLAVFRWASPESTIVSVDPSAQPIATEIAEYWDPGLQHTLLVNKRSDAAFDQGDIAACAPYDLVLLDGDHSERQCRLDWECIQPFLATNAVILFDDVDFPGPRAVFDETDLPKYDLHSHSRAAPSIPNHMGVVFTGQIPGKDREIVRTSPVMPLSKVTMSKYKRDTAICLLGDGLGNVIEQTCMVQAVKSMYTHVDVWLPRSTRACLGAIKPLVGARHAWYGPQLPDEIRAHYDAAFHSFLVGTPHLRQLRFTTRFSMRHPTRACAGDRSEAEIAVRAARDAGFEGDTPRPFCAWVEYKGDDVKRPLLGLSTGGNPRPVWQLKRYPHWGDVVDYLHEKLPDLSFALLGTAGDDPINRSFVQDFRGLTFQRSAGLIRLCSAVLANDNALSHTAAAMGVRTFTLFGPTLITKNAAMYNTVPIFHREIPCRPCQYSPAKMGRRFRGNVKEQCRKECLADLDPIVVANQVLRYLDNEQFCDHGDGPEWYTLSRSGDEYV